MGEVLYDLGSRLSVWLNERLGGVRGESLSLRIGRSIHTGGFWSRFPLPDWFRDHCLRVFWRIGSSTSP